MCTKPQNRHKHAREYSSWSSMKNRCTRFGRRDSSRYVGRGITYCTRWEVFANFLADMGPHPAGTSLDRFPDNTGNYEPGNCRWATLQQQANNTRDNVLLTHNGETCTLREWANRTGIRSQTLYARIHVLKWSDSDVIIRPLESHKRK